MKRKFKPYLDIKDKKQLQFLLNRQNNIEENYFDLSQIKECTVEAFKEGVIKVKNFYGYTPKGEDVEYIDELIYHMLVIQVLQISTFQYTLDIIATMRTEDNEEIAKMMLNPIDEGSKKEIEFLCNEIESINQFIKKYYGDDFYALKSITPEELMKLNFDDFYKLLNKIKAVILIIGNYAKNFRLKMLIFNIVNFTKDSDFRGIKY